MPHHARPPTCDQCRTTLDAKFIHTPRRAAHSPAAGAAACRARSPACGTHARPSTLAPGSRPAPSPPGPPPNQTGRWASGSGLANPGWRPPANLPADLVSRPTARQPRVLAYVTDSLVCMFRPTSWASGLSGSQRGWPPGRTQEAPPPLLQGSPRGPACELAKGGRGRHACGGPLSNRRRMRRRPKWHKRAL